MFEFLLSFSILSFITFISLHWFTFCCRFLSIWFLLLNLLLLLLLFLLDIRLCQLFISTILAWFLKFLYFSCLSWIDSWNGRCRWYSFYAKLLIFFPCFVFLVRRYAFRLLLFLFVLWDFSVILFGWGDFIEFWFWITLIGSYFLWWSILNVVLLYFNILT